MNVKWNYTLQIHSSCIARSCKFPLVLNLWSIFGFMCCCIDRWSCFHVSLKLVEQSLLCQWTFALMHVMIETLTLFGVTVHIRLNEFDLFAFSCILCMCACTCVCIQEFHYHPRGSDTCLPCDCYPVGSFSRSCDSETGQCQCRPGVIGRQCNTCDNPFAEVTNSGCEGEKVFFLCPFRISVWSISVGASKWFWMTQQVSASFICIVSFCLGLHLRCCK